MPALNNVGRNLVHNPLFNIWQRGNGPFTALGALAADRWQLWMAGDTLSVSRYTPTDTNRTQIGDEAARNAMAVTVTGNAAAGSASALLHKIEGIARLSGKTVTLSFWANSTVAGYRVGINAMQRFGTGGSPSASAWALASGLVVTITGTTWARYSVMMTVPSMSGLTLGTNGDDCLEFDLFLSASGAPYASISGIGTQSGTVRFWGVQLEIGSVATPLEKPDPQQDLAKCQRFYIGYNGTTGGIWIYTNGINSGSAGMAMSQTLLTTMRATPTVTLIDAGSSNITGLGASALNANSIRVTGTGGAGSVSFNVIVSASADL
jgi:hypothetical protein